MRGLPMRNFWMECGNNMRNVDEVVDAHLEECAERAKHEMFKEHLSEEAELGNI